MKRRAAVACAVQGLLLAAALVGCAADCKYRLDLVQANSTLSLLGVSTLVSPTGNEVDADISYPKASAPVGLQGPLYLVISNVAACPDTTEKLLATAQKWRVSSFASWADPGLLHVYPDTIPALVSTFPFTLSNLALNVTSTRIASFGRTVVMALVTEIAQGYVYTDNPTTGKHLDSLVGYKNITTVSGTVEIVNDTASSGSVVRMRMQDVALHFAMKAAQLQGAGANYSGRTFLKLEGSLLGQAVLDCPSYCGDHGVCQVLKGRPGCVCECGWSVDKDGTCSVPEGFCPATGAVTSVQYLPAPATTAAAPAAPASGLVPAAEDGSCPQGYTFSVSAAACAACPAGFTGASCGLCLNDDVCRASTGSSKATCSTELTFDSRTRNKAYSCALTSKSLSSLLGPTIDFACSTSPPAGSQTSGPSINALAAGSASAAEDVIGTTAYCSINLTISDMGVARPINCTTWDCRFSDGSADARCGTTRCSCFKNDCKGKTTDYTPLFASIKRGISITCDRATSQCTLKLDDLPVNVDLNCTAAECLSPEGAATVGKAAKPQKSTRDRRLISVAAVPAMVLLLVAALLLSLLASQWAYMKRPPATPAPPPGTATAYALGRAEEHSGAVQADPRLAAGPPLALAAAAKGEAAVNGGTAVLVNGTAAAGVVNELGFWDIKVSHQPRTLRSFLCRRGKRGEKGARSTNGSSSSGSDDLQIMPLVEPYAKPILHGVTACAKRGQVLGVLGPSGGGKSTLLGVLTGQVSNDGPWAVSGRLALDGAPVGARAVARVAALVPQDDHLLRCLTVAECLSYSAALRLDVRLSPDEVRAQVDAVLRQLGLYHLRDRRVYSAGGAAGVSGGERRRVSIGMELVTRPRVLVLDEATSGLDSFSAAGLVKLLRGVASESDCVVMMSIHQPSPAIFNMLDQVLLLALGRQLYFGTPADATAAIARLGAPCPTDIPIAEHLLQVACDPDRLMPLLATLATLPAPPLPPVAPHVAGQTLVRALSADVLTPRYRFRRALRELGILFWRAVMDMARNPGLLLLHWAVGILMGLLIGFIFYHVNNNIDGAQNRVGAVFFAIALMGFTAITSCDLILAEHAIVERECRRRYYSPLAYMTTKVVLDSLLLRAVPAVLFGAPFYWLMRLRPQLTAYFIFQFVLIAFTATAGTLAMLLAALLRTAGRTIVVMNLVLLVGVLFAGFLANINSITPVLRWLSWLSLFRYAWEAIVVNEFTAITLNIVIKNLPAVPEVRGSLFLEIIGVRTDMLATDIAVMIALYFAFFALALLTLHLRVRYS